MKMGFIPGAVPGVARLANDDPTGMMGLLHKAQSIACGKIENHELSDVNIFTVGKHTETSKVAIAYEDGVAIVVDTGKNVSLKSAGILAKRLNRANWKQHMVFSTASFLSSVLLNFTFTLRSHCNQIGRMTYENQSRKRSSQLRKPGE